MAMRRVSKTLNPGSNPGSRVKECPETNTGEHWWLILLGGGRKCWFCNKEEK